MASRARASTWAGTICPDSMNINMVHGTSPGVGTIRFEETAFIPAGSWMILSTGATMWYGRVVSYEVNQDDQRGEETKVKAVDWRDKLHDNHYYGAFNMQEDDGRYWHLMPSDWDFQRKTYVTKPVLQQDFFAFQELDGNENLIRWAAQNTLISALTIINLLAARFGFNPVYDNLVRNILAKSYPLNLNWNSGVTAANAVQSALDKCGLQFTAIGSNIMYITLRGFSVNVFANAWVNGFNDICLFAARTGSIGEAVNEKGRRVELIGDRNKHQWNFLCKPNWPPAWTWRIVFGGWYLSAILKLHGLTRLDKVRDLPVEFHDIETWQDADSDALAGAIPERRTRNDMTIADYVEKIPFHTYVVDFTKACTPFTRLMKDDYEGTVWPIDRDTLDLAGFDLGDIKGILQWSDWNNQAINSKFPLSSKLVADSNIQHLTWAVTRTIPQGLENPFAQQLTMTPLDKGNSISVEEVLSPVTGQNSYRVRVHFSEPRYFLNKNVQDFFDLKSVLPDRPLCTLSLDRDVFKHEQGDLATSLRVRTRKRNIRNLYNAHINGEEKQVLAQNFVQNLAPGVGGPGPFVFSVKALQVAQKIAAMLLFHQAIDKTGHLEWDESAGFHPDGLIDSVNFRFDSVGGFTERINLTAEWLSDEVIPMILAVPISAKLDTESEIIRDRLLQAGKDAMKAKGDAGATLEVMGATLGALGGMFGMPAAERAWSGGPAEYGSIKVKAEKEVFEAIEFCECDVMVIGKKKEVDQQ